MQYSPTSCMVGPGIDVPWSWPPYSALIFLLGFGLLNMPLMSSLFYRTTVNERGAHFVFLGKHDGCYAEAGK